MHWRFERIHPFSDGNGRVGRLLLVKECLRIGTLPPLIRDEHHNLYVRALTNFPDQPGWLAELLLGERDFYRDAVLERLAPGELDYAYHDQWDAAIPGVAQRRESDLTFAAAIDAHGRH